jgi:site-specific recombinase XerD
MAATDFTATIAELRLVQSKLRSGLMARNTIVGYRYDWLMFEKFCCRFHLAALPATAETVGLHLTSLLAQGNKITTARRRKFAIAYQHREAGLPSPVTGEVGELLLGAQRLRAEKPRQMRPITVAELRQMSAGLALSGTAIDLRNRALLVLGFASSLRRSNLTALDLADVEFCRQGVILRICREKQDQEGKGRLVALPRGKHRDTDPARVLRAWLRVRGHYPGALFPRVAPPHSGERLDGESVCRVVKKCLRGVGIDAAQCGAHSLRAGFVTAAAEANLSTLRISAFTGQSPETVKRYFRRSDLWRNNVCASVGL